jgi:hypothetical protein
LHSWLSATFFSLWFWDFSGSATIWLLVAVTGPGISDGEKFGLGILPLLLAGAWGGDDAIALTCWSVMAHP